MEDLAESHQFDMPSPKQSESNQQHKNCQTGQTAIAQPFWMGLHQALQDAVSLSKSYKTQPVWLNHGRLAELSLKLNHLFLKHKNKTIKKKWKTHILADISAGFSHGAKKMLKGFSIQKAINSITF